MVHVSAMALLELGTGVTEGLKLEYDLSIIFVVGDWIKVTF